MELKYVPFTKRVREIVAPNRYYYVFASNRDGSFPKLLGIVRRSGDTGKWTADHSVFPPVPHEQRYPVRTRSEAAYLLLRAHAQRCRERLLVNMAARDRARVRVTGS